MPEKSPLDLLVIDKVREKRNEKGLSQAQMAHLLNKSVGFIGHIESPNTRAKYNLQHLNELAKILNCSIKDFLPDPYLDFED